jgi:ERCC4-type nuclease
MVQVTVRVRPKNGYTYTGKIKTETLGSDKRLEELLQRHGTSNSSASSHAAFYFNGLELPLNTSIASQDLDNGVIIETCKSPTISAALSAVLRDIDAIGKVPAEARTSQTITDLLQVPPNFLTENVKNAGFYDVKKWNDEAIKSRKICLAIMKKILQRDDRYAIHDLECCTDIESLHRHIKPAFDHDSTRNIHNPGGNRQWNNIGNLFTDKTKKNGQPSTIYTLLSHKLNIQVEVAADFVKPTEGGSLDALEEFIYLDTLRHPAEGNASSRSTPQRRGTRRPANSSNDAAANAQARPQTNSDSNNGHTSTSVSSIQSPSRVRQRKEYCPEFASGPFAILCTLIEAQEGNHRNSNGRRQLSLTENQLKRLAQPRCRANFYDRQIGRGSRSAFACMEKMSEKNLVRKEIIREGEERWALLPNGEKMAKACLAFEKAVNDTIPSFQSSTENVNRNNDAITLIVDNREDIHFRERIRLQSEDDRVLTEERELPAGDYLFLQDNAVIPLVIERKTWSDLADSVQSKGKAHRRLDCVKLGSSYSSCPRQNCQLCKMKKSGCAQIMFIIEGARCQGTDSFRGSTCSEQKRCQHCRALLDRHGANVTQEALEQALTRLQVEHGCYVHFTRSYNETITSLFSIQEILKEGTCFAASMIKHSHDGNRSSDRLTYEQFCANARSSQASQHDSRRKNDMLEWRCEDLVSIITNNFNTWRSSMNKEFNRTTTTAMNGTTSNKRSGGIGENSSKRQRLNSNDEHEIIELNDSQEEVAVHLLDSDSDDSTINLLDDSQEVEVIELGNSQDSIQILEDIDMMHGCESAVTPNLETHSLIMLHGWDDYDERFSKEINKRWQECYSEYGTLIGTIDDNGEARTTSTLCQYAVRQMTAMINSGNISYLPRTSVITAILWLQIRLGLLVRPVTREKFALELKEKWTNTCALGLQNRLGSQHQSPSSNNNSTISQRRARPLHDPTTRNLGKSQEPPASSAQISSRRNDPPVSSFVPPSNTRMQQSYSSPKSVPIIEARKQQSHPSPKRAPAIEARKQQSHPSPKRALAIEARLRRFENAGSSSSKVPDRQLDYIPSNTVPQYHHSTFNSEKPISSNIWNCGYCTFENTLEAKKCTACLKPMTNTWACLECTFHNNMEAVECTICDSPNPDSSAGVEKTLTPKWQCSVCTLNNDMEVLVCETCGVGTPNSIHTARTSHNHVPSPMASASKDLNSHVNRTTIDRHPSSIPPSSSKKSVRCGACGLEGHNRGTATAASCPAYNDEAEIQRREEKWRNIQEKAITAEQEVLTLQREEQSRQARQERLRGQMDAMAEDMERSSVLNAAEIERRRKKAEIARRRAARGR